MRLQIYAANLTQGGAVVTASSLLAGVLEAIQDRDADWVESLEVVLSPQVAANLPTSVFMDPTSKTNFLLREDKPGSAPFRTSNLTADVRFAMFGPEYARSRARVNVTGFADGTLIPSWQHIGSTRRPRKTLRQISRATIKKRVLGRYDAYVVQTRGMAQSLAQLFPNKKISILPNLLSRPFSHPESREIRFLPKPQAGEARFFFPAKAYPHKNHRILAYVSREYRERFGQRLRFFVTLDQDEFLTAIPSDCDDIYNVGPVPAVDLPSLYEQTDGLFFPSLNETFSSAPLEACFMRKPVVASDRPFAHEILGRLAWYFNPEDPIDAAIQIRSVIQHIRHRTPEFEQTLESAKSWADRHANPKQSALKLLEFLHSAGC